MQYLRQYNTDNTSTLSHIELMSMLDFLGSTLSAETPNSFFMRNGKKPVEDKLTVRWPPNEKGGGGLPFPLRKGVNFWFEYPWYTRWFRHGHGVLVWRQNLFLFIMASIHADTSKTTPKILTSWRKYPAVTMKAAIKPKWSHHQIHAPASR
jgi:hypothetical protein